MGRNDTKGTSLRNRHRVTNKTRLKVFIGSIDAENVNWDDDEEKGTVVNTAGVDAEDAGEQHLQEVLSAAALRSHAAPASRSTRSGAGNTNEKTEQPASYIPTPDATGVVANYVELYPPSKWKDPITHNRFSDTVEESVEAGLVEGFTYLMDERDVEWLEKNNAAARGEGTSSAAAASGAATRSTGRSAKAKGKEPEMHAAVPLTEDEFELVMGIFELFSHQKFPFLHLDPSTCPPFQEYEQVFASPLPASFFATYTVPASVPQPSQLFRAARAVYPHWRERKMEREMRRIIPQLNFDDANEGDSYVCFRRRDVKPVRKTRRTDTTYVDKLSRLKAEIGTALQIASMVVQREMSKKDTFQHSRLVFDSRVKLVDLKRKNPSFGTKEDEELLVDKDRVVKKQKTNDAIVPIRLPKPRTTAEVFAPVTFNDVQKHPKERAAAITASVEKEVNRKKEQDQHWEEVTDMSYISIPIPPPNRLFRPIPSENSPAVSSRLDRAQRASHAPSLRLRMGRGGRMCIDRRGMMASIRARERSTKVESLTESEKQEAMERERRQAAQWRFDGDDWNREDDERIIVDDYENSFLRPRSRLLTDQDMYMLLPDVSFVQHAFQAADQRSTAGPLIRAAAQQRKEGGNIIRPAPAPGQGPVLAPLPPTPVAMPSAAMQAALAQAQAKKLQPPLVQQQHPRQMNGIRMQQHPITGPTTTPSPASGVPVATNPSNVPTNGVSGPKPVANTTGNGLSSAAPAPHPNAIPVAPDSAPPMHVSSPMRQKAIPHPNGVTPNGMTNGFTGSVGGQFSAFPNPVGNSMNYIPHHPMGLNNRAQQQLTMQQNLAIQAAFASGGKGPQGQTQVQQGAAGHQQFSMPPNVSANGMNIPANMNLKLPPGRAPWTQNANGTGAAGFAMPRTPSANGHHLGPAAMGRASPVTAHGHPHHLTANHHMTPHRSPTPLINAQHASPPQGSPPNAAHPPLPTPSPSQQQVVGGPGQGHGY